MRRQSRTTSSSVYVRDIGTTIPADIVTQALLPFAIIGSEEEIEIDGQPVRARIYPWGIAEVDNPKHSDFSRLRSALLK
jgi:cell division control protein 11